MPIKKYGLYFLVVLSLFLTTCTPEASATSLNDLRFYADESKVINILTKRSTLNAAEHLKLAEAYSKRNKLKKALFHYIQAAFIDREASDLKLYAEPINTYLDRSFFRSPYYDVACYKVADIFYKYKEYKYVITFCNKVSVDDPALYFNSIKLVMSALSKQNKYTEAINYSKKIDTIVTNNNLLKLLKIQKASLYKKMNDFTTAGKVFSEIIEDNPTSWHAHTAGIELFSLYKNNTLTLSYRQKELLLEALISSGNKVEAKKIVDTMNANSDQTLLQKYRYYIKIKNYKQADLLLHSIKPESDLYVKLQLAGADILWYTTKSRAVAVYKEYVEKGKASQKQFSRICHYFYQRNRSTAINYMVQFIDKYPDTSNAQEFMWLHARTYIIKKEFEIVLPLLEKIIENKEHRFYGNAAYWLFYYYKEKDPEKAKKYFKHAVINSADSSYTWMIADQLKKGYQVETLQKQFDSALVSHNADDAIFSNFMLFLHEKNSSTKDIRIQKIKLAGLYPYNEFDTYLLQTQSSIFIDLFSAYFDAGYFEGVTSLLQYLDEDQKNRKFKFLVMSHFGNMYGHHYYGYLGSIRLLREFNIDENIALFPHSFAKRLYPLAFDKIVNKIRKKYSAVTAYHVYSVMKAESAFRYNAVSPVGATGLMQVMPATGRGIAQSLKIKKYSLKDPTTSILFGFEYLNWLSSLYRGEFDQMLGGYNAGPGNMNKWRKNFVTNDKIFFAESVPFYETRHYMFKNQKFLLHYQTMYGVESD